MHTVSCTLSSNLRSSNRCRPHRVEGMSGTTTLSLDAASAGGAVLRLRVWRWRLLSCMCQRHVKSTSELPLTGLAD